MSKASKAPKHPALTLVRVPGKKQLPQILATGAELKSAFCLTKGNDYYVYAGIGSLDNLESLETYKNSVSRSKHLLKVEPKIISYDLHPNYMSSIFAKSLPGIRSTGYRLLSVQHHFAHIASVLAEKQLEKSVIGFAFDGTGFGTDGKIWGGECLLWKSSKFTRLAHFDYFKLPGGDLAVKEVWRLAVSLLQFAGTNEIPAHIKKKPWKQIREMALKGINSPECCSAGRLFDAVAAIIGLKNEVSFEAQAAIELESLAVDTKVKKGYTLRSKLETRNTKLEKPLVIPTTQLIRQIWKDKKAGVSNKVIAAKFHFTLSELMLNLSKQFGRKYDIKDIALSGGCFQNKILLSQAVEKLEKSGFRVHYNQLVPVNDTCIALGQAFLATKRKS